MYSLSFSLNCKVETISEAVFLFERLNEKVKYHSGMYEINIDQSISYIPEQVPAPILSGVEVEVETGEYLNGPEEI